MKAKIYFLAISIFLFLNYNLTAQTKVSEMLWIVNESGDSLMTSQIFDKKTNEDQVVFMWEGRKKVLKAKEVKSYFKQSRKQSIIVSPDNQSKLVSIVLSNNISLARSTSLNRTDMFYILINKEWIRLDPRSKNLKPQLLKLIPDFGEAKTEKNIYYDLVSIGEAISRYNEFKEPGYKKIGKFHFQNRVKVGAFGSIGLASLNINDFDVNLGVTTSTTFGIGTHIQYSRLISTLIQLGFSQNNWKGENFDIKLKTLDLTPLICIPLYNKSNFIKAYAASGFIVKIDIASQLKSPEFKTAPSIGLAGLNFGYDFQLHSSFGEKFDIFASYQHMPKISSKNYELLSPGKTLKFKTNIFRLGFLYYL